MGLFSDIHKIKPMEEITKALTGLVSTGYEYGKGVFQTKSGVALEELGDYLQKQGRESVSEADRRAYAARRAMGPLPGGAGNLVLIGGAVAVAFLLFRRG